MGNEALKKWLNLSIFMEEWRVEENCDRYELSVGNWEKQQGLAIQILLCVTLSSELRMSLSSGYKEGNSHMKVL